MYLIGLTGGIAAGKSVVSARLAELGAVIVDADVLAREVVEPGTQGLELIAAEFGPTVIRPDGTLDRPALGAIIFADAAKRAALNAITHPAILNRTVELIDAARSADPHAVVVNDIPLLAERRTSGPLQYDLIVVVHADLETRIARMVELRGMSHEEAQQRLNSQASDEQRLSIADVIIDNSGTLEHTLEQADALWRAARDSAEGKHPE